MTRCLLLHHLEHLHNPDIDNKWGTRSRINFEVEVTDHKIGVIG